MDSEDICVMGLAVCSLYLANKLIKKQNTRRFYSRAENLDRQINGFYTTCFLPMKTNEEEFFKHTRMLLQAYESLFSLIKPKLRKRKTKYTICEEARFALTLSYLSQAVSSLFLGWSFKMGHSTVWNILYETCDAIWNILSPEYCRVPNEADYKIIVNGFENKWDLPHRVGAIDGRHMSIIAPPHSGSKFYNYTKIYSIVLLAACDSNYVFTMVEVSAYGSQSDGGILAESPFGKQLLSKSLLLPQNKYLPNFSTTFPYFFIGDPAFPLRQNLMRPYSGKYLSKEQKVFNYRISRGGVVIENAFGILVARWGVLQTILKCIPENTERIILACVALHNFLILCKTSVSAYCPPSLADAESAIEDIILGQWRTEVAEGATAGLQRLTRQMSSNNASRLAFHLRNAFGAYFQMEGAIPRQLKIK